VSLINETEGTLCTASLIADGVAITAAHCVAGDTSHLHISFGTSAKGHEARNIDETATTPDWGSNSEQDTNTGDIALLRFSGGIPKNYAPVRLLASRHKFKDGDTVQLAGFGVTNGQRQSGAGTLHSVDVTIADANFSETEVLLDQTQGKGACHGDSGGPAFVRSKSGVLYLWGITSRGSSDPSDTCSGQSIYTKVSAFSKWIKSTAKSWRLDEDQ
jgi:secreted trypsin-like serine protease